MPGWRPGASPCWTTSGARPSTGQKHIALLRHATALGGIQAAAGFTDAEAVQWLMDALPDTVLDWDAAKRTAADGLARGRAKPIELEDRPRPFRQWAAEAERGPAILPNRMVRKASKRKASSGTGYNAAIAPRYADDVDAEPPRHLRTGTGGLRWMTPRSSGQLPIDFLTDPNSEAPELRHEHIPEAINDFVFDTAARMGVRSNLRRPLVHRVLRLRRQR